MTPLALTSGEPAGVGPELAASLFRQEETLPPTVILGDKDLLCQRGGFSDLPLYPTKTPLSILHVPSPHPINAGEPRCENAPYVLSLLQRACEGVLRHEFKALVTAPVDKKILASALPNFSGHTEWLKEATGSRRALMTMVNRHLKVALVTTHLPLSKVPEAITQEAVQEALAIFAQGLTGFFGIERPRIAVAGLNPHAGDGGLLGDEEIRIIAPAIAKARESGTDAFGPFAADTLFASRQLGHPFDAYLAMYHDQGLAVAKTLDFFETVNLTLGLPFVRTSVDHGTAYDLAGTGKASVKPLLAALHLAARLASP